MRDVQLAHIVDCSNKKQNCNLLILLVLYLFKIFYDTYISFKSSVPVALRHNSPLSIIIKKKMGRKEKACCKVIITTQCVINAIPPFEYDLLLTLSRLFITLTDTPLRIFVFEKKKRLYFTKTVKFKFNCNSSRCSIDFSVFFNTF